MRVVAVSFGRDVMTGVLGVGELVSRHHPSGARDMDGIAASAWRKRPLKRRLLYWVCFETLPGALGGVEHWWQRSAETRAGMGCVGLRRDLTLGHQQLVRCGLPFGESCMQLAMCTVIKPVFLKPIIQDRWAVSQISHASRGNSRGLVLRCHAGCYMHVPMALAM